MSELKTKLEVFSREHNGYLPGTLGYLITQDWVTEEDLRKELRLKVQNLYDFKENVVGIGGLTFRESDFLIRFSKGIL